MATKNPDRSGDSIYAYETKQGTRYRFVYRDPSGKQSQKRGFTSRTVAKRERERIISQVRRGELRVSRQTLGEYWERYMVRRKPYLEAGTWNDYASQGRKRLLPRFGDGDVSPKSPLFVTPPRSGRDGHGDWAGGRVGEPMERSIVSSSWHKAALQDAGLRDMPLHSLRHTAAAAWLATGHPLFYVQRQLGHSQITTTERIYAHLEETFMRSAAAETEEAIARAGGLFTEG